MTEKLFYQDAYLKEFDANVVSVNGNRIALDKTAFFATAGGQTGDTGEINGIRVVDTVYNDGKEIVNVLEREPDFKVGDTIHGKIDWDRRYHIMRLHSACHVISGVVIRHFPNSMFTGSNIYPDKARMDFNIERLDDEVSKMIEGEANGVVQGGLPIEASMTTWDEVDKDSSLMRVDRSLYEKYGEPRVVDIVGFDKQLDGGTHVKTTKEIGKISIVKRENKGKNNRRIYIVVK